MEGVVTKEWDPESLKGEEIRVFFSYYINKIYFKVWSYCMFKKYYRSSLMTMKKYTASSHNDVNDVTVRHHSTNHQ